MDDQLLFSTIGRFVVEGVNGQNEDVFSFMPVSIGENTSGTFDGDLFFDGSQFGFTGNLAAVDFSIA
ncbi:MAG: hypothetical protein AAF921_08850 [Cyanobacteria bacterium P01_D01_bin.44]